MKILATFITDRFSVLKNFWKRAKTNRKKAKFYGTDKSENLDLGGLILIIDWKNKKIIKKRNIKTPAGFDFEDDKIYVNTSGNSISQLSENLTIEKKIILPFLNDLHSLNVTKSGTLLVTSTGLDAIIEVDKKGKELFSWFAMDRGYYRDPKGRRREINKRINHRYKKYPTLRQTTHLNSAIYVGKTKYFSETIYCSLFHQGEIIAIDKENGNFKVVLRNLNHPHSIYKIEKIIVLSDTENNKIILTDLNFKSPKRIKLKGFNWIQDTSLLKSGNFLICDANNNRIVEFDLETNKVISKFNFNKEWRIYQAKQIL